MLSSGECASRSLAEVQKLEHAEQPSVLCPDVVRIELTRAKDHGSNAPGQPIPTAAGTTTRTCLSITTDPNRWVNINK